jgi:hypothetical protein
VFDLGGNDVSRIVEHGAIVAQKDTQRYYGGFVSKRSQREGVSGQSCCPA